MGSSQPSISLILLKIDRSGGHRRGCRAGGRRHVGPRCGTSGQSGARTLGLAAAAGPAAGHTPAGGAQDSSLDVTGARDVELEAVAHVPLSCRRVRAYPYPELCGFLLDALQRRGFLKFLFADTAGPEISGAQGKDRIEGP
jgi:hypothetical protein